MKNIIFFIFFFPLLCFAQTKTRYYSKEIKVSGVAKDELLSKAKKWFLYNNSIASKKIISVNEKKGEILGEANFDCTTNPPPTCYYIKVCSFKIIAANEKCRFIVINWSEDLVYATALMKDSIAPLPFFTLWDSSMSEIAQTSYLIPVDGSSNTLKNNTPRKNYSKKEMTDELVNTLAKEILN